MIQWLAERSEDGVVHARVGREGDRLVAEWSNVLRLFSSRDGTRSSTEIAPDADPRLVRKIERGAVPVLLRQLRGEIGLHGAAVALGGGAIVLIGDSGAGKSTLGASLVKLEGASFLADDVVALDRAAWTVVPLEREHWLDATSRRALGLSSDDDDDEEKKPVEPLRDATSPLPLVMIVQVTYADEIRSRRLGSMEALAALVPQTLRFVIDEPEAQRAEIEALASLLEAIPVFRLERPCRIDLLATVAAEVAAWARVARTPT